MRNNGLKANPNKFHLILSETDDHYSVNVDKFKVVNSKSKKLLGVKIDSKMTFNDHVSGICTKASQRLHALSRISNYMNLEQRKTNMTFYSLSIWLLSFRLDVSQ